MVAGPPTPVAPTILTPDEVLQGYDAVSALYPHVPSLSHWRAWEYAAYRRFAMPGRILDLGCGDGRYFRLIWPDSDDAVGVEIDPAVASLGRDSGVYHHVHVAAAHRVPEPDATFDSVFANCSLEHMDELDAVLGEIRRCLKPGGLLACSVVTDRFVDWALLPNLVAQAGFGQTAAELREDFLAYHHLVSPLPIPAWEARLATAGLVVEHCIPILPECNSGIFLLMEGLWHYRKGPTTGEMGDAIHAYLRQNPRFPKGFRQVIAGLMDMETDWHDTSGAVFIARRSEVVT